MSDGEGRASVAESTRMAVARTGVSQARAVVVASLLAECASSGRGPVPPEAQQHATIISSLRSARPSRRDAVRSGPLIHGRAALLHCTSSVREVG